jgi:hypothetical protein
MVHHEPLQQQSLDDKRSGHAVGRGAVVCSYATDDTTTQISERQARFEDFAADIVDIDVDAILRQRF